MRTKTLLLTAALTAAGVATSMAQVYSVNAVGYVNLTMLPAAGGGFTLIGNPLKAGGNTLAEVIPVAPDGTQFLKFTTGAGFSTYTYDELEPGWLPTGTVSFAPGEGGFLKNNTGSAFVITFVGEVMQGSLNNPIPATFSVRGSQVPQAADVNVLSLTDDLPEGAQLYKFAPPSGPYSTFTRDDLEAGGWTPFVPSLGVGEAVYLQTSTAQNWDRTFSVNP